MPVRAERNRCEVMGPVKEEVVRLSAVSLGYASRAVLCGVDLTISSGEVWCITGANGEGKSTLLKGIIGELPPLVGERICSVRDFLGYVPQSCTAARTLPTSVEEFVRLGLVGLPLTRQARDERFSVAVRRCGLAEILADPYRFVSGGERRRALIARALIRHPRLLALDEPTAGLDEAGIEQLVQMIAELTHDGDIAMVIVTHDSAFAARVATHRVVVERGTVHQP